MNSLLLYVFMATAIKTKANNDQQIARAGIFKAGWTLGIHIVSNWFSGIKTNWGTKYNQLTLFFLSTANSWNCWPDPTNAQEVFDNMILWDGESSLLGKQFKTSRIFRIPLEVNQEYSWGLAK